ncbi:hypothetical protein G4B88_008312 [Cannabis sativa]|uniref:Uncharacterized protein n=1 Tax=Cannabis sativa TaxID=3483 RepID=A0A7J6G7P7_CANSA|nr:hypothetical protein G4B88_008312 [Cannabis sativa]
MEENGEATENKALHYKEKWDKFQANNRDKGRPPFYDKEDRLVIFQYSHIMTGHFSSNRAPKLRLWQKCSRLVKEQRTRFYIMWRCTVILLSWDDGL